jgi:ubiquitin carboxyl-terminal hydrolase 26/29/37
LKGDIEKLNNLCSTEREPENGDLSPQMFAGDTVTKLFVCPIVANFEYELQVSIICKACGQVALKTEQNNYISINLHQEKNPFFPSIQNYFDLFFKEEEVKYNCEKCKNQNSILKNKFHQLPRVLIVHLKRYSLNDHWLLVKNGRQVEIPKYLSLSSHCNENTRPPCPLDSHVPVGDRKVSQEMVSEILSNSAQALKLTSEPNDPLDLCMGPDEDAELQTVQRIYEGASQEQEQTVLGSASKLEPELVKSRNQTLSEKKLPASKSMTDEGDISLPMICEDEGKPVSIPDPGFSGAHLQEVPEIPDLKNYKQTNILGELDYYSVTGLLKGLYGYCENKNPEGQGMAKQHQQHHEKRFKEEFLQLTPPPSVRKLDIQENTDKDLCRSSELRLQKDDLTSLGALGSDKNPENKYISESENIADEAKKPKTVKTGDPLRTYRLISIVSHIGSSHKSGHYISDVYDFGKQAWFTYNDLKVSEIPEARIQEARLCSGYIFFYMHSEIFETLLEKAANSKLLSTQAGEIPQEAYEEEDFFHRLLDYLTPSIEGISEHCPE